MNKIILNAVIFLSANVFAQITNIDLIQQKDQSEKLYPDRTITNVTNQEQEEQEEINTIYSVKNLGDKLIINDNFELKQGIEIQVYLPANGKDFMFINSNKGLNTKLLGEVADVVGTGASAVGFGSGNIRIIQGASKVLNGANAVRYGANAIEKIQDLPISNKAKRIAGKKIKIVSWEMDNEDYILKGELNHKKYLINLQKAVMTGEIKLR